MTTIIIDNPIIEKKYKTHFKDEREMIIYFMEEINYDYIDFNELEKNEVDTELLWLVEKSKNKDVSEFDNI